MDKIIWSFICFSMCNIDHKQIFFAIVSEILFFHSERKKMKEEYSHTVDILHF